MARLIRAFPILMSALAAGALLAGTAFAVPQGFNVQGRLTDSNGVNRNGTYSIKFSIWNRLEGGDPVADKLWEASLDNVSVRNGNFQVVLGAQGQPALGNSFSGDSAYLEMTVLLGPDVPSAEPPLTPRMQLVSVPYAIKSQTTQGVPRDIEVSNLIVTESLQATGELAPNFDSGDIRVGGGQPGDQTLNSNIRLDHNLGSRPRRVAIWISEGADRSGVSVLSSGYGGSWPAACGTLNGVGITRNESNYALIRIGEALAVANDPGRGNFCMSAGYVRVLMWK